MTIFLHINKTEKRIGEKSPILLYYIYRRNGLFPQDIGAKKIEEKNFKKIVKKC